MKARARRGKHTGRPRKRLSQNVTNVFSHEFDKRHTPLNHLNPLECIRMILGPRHFPAPWSTAKSATKLQSTRFRDEAKSKRATDGKSYRLLRTDSTLFQSSNESNALTSRSCQMLAMQSNLHFSPEINDLRRSPISNLITWMPFARNKKGRHRHADSCGQLPLQHRNSVLSPSEIGMYASLSCACPWQYMYIFFQVHLRRKSQNKSLLD